MAKNERNRQKRLAKKKKKRILKKKKLKFESSLSGQLTQALKMPIYECLAPEELEERGLDRFSFPEG
jgi:hypothetical protein